MTRSPATVFARRTAGIAALVALGAALVAAISDRGWALGIALGALIAVGNFVAIALTVGRQLDAETPGALVGPVSWLARGTLSLLALVLVLWYMPARLEGIALGIVIALASAVAAALSMRPEDPS